jgi:hypothetical protein
MTIWVVLGGGLLLGGLDLLVCFVHGCSWPVEGVSEVEARSSWEEKSGMEQQWVPGAEEIKALFIYFSQMEQIYHRPKVRLLGSVEIEGSLDGSDGGRGFLATRELLCRIAASPSKLQVAE